MIQALDINPSLGLSSKGLQASLTVEKDRFQSNEGVAALLTVTNVSLSPIHIDPWAGDWTFHVFDEQMHRLPSARPRQTIHPTRHLLTLQPRERWETKISESTPSGLPGWVSGWQYSLLEPGTYWLSAEYSTQHYSGRSELWTGFLDTKPVKIEITPENGGNLRGEELAKRYPDLPQFQQLSPVQETMRVILKKYFADVRFYLADFDTMHREYSKTGAIVAEKIDLPNVYSCLDLNYTEVPQDFLKLFIGAKASTDKDALLMTRTITALFAKTVVNGRAETVTEKLSTGGHEVLAEIIQDEKVYKRLKFIFDDQYQLAQISVKNPEAA